MWDPRLEDAEELVARGGRWDGLGQWRRAEADYRAALARRPDSYGANEALARLLAQEPGRGDPEEAVRLARIATDPRPPRASYRQTLGLALYRAGRYADAATVAESNYSWSTNVSNYARDWGGFDRVVLAMSRQRLGQAAAARATLAEAVRWRAGRTDFPPDRAAAFDRLLREARSVVNEVLPDLPADVFAR
jgi:tetratricopeptide (TPR) repeat protein